MNKMMNKTFSVKNEIVDTKESSFLVLVPKGQARETEEWKKEVQDELNAFYNNKNDRS